MTGPAPAMPDRERLDRRLGAVERAISGDDRDLEALASTGDLARRVEALEEELEAAEDRISELEAATQALRGYVGSIRSVNEDVEQRADAAIAAVDRLEGRLDGGGNAGIGDRRAVGSRGSRRDTDAEHAGRFSPQRVTDDQSGHRLRSSERSSQSDRGASGDHSSPSVSEVSGDQTGSHASGTQNESDSGGVLARLRTRL